MKRVFLIVLFILLNCSIAFSATLSLIATWSANTEADMASYKFYRTDGTRTLLGTIAHPTTTFNFSVTVPDNSQGTLKFVLTAVDISGNESGDSNEAPFVFDAAAPSSPVGLGVTKWEGEGCGGSMAFEDGWLVETQTGGSLGHDGVSGINQRCLIEAAHIIASGSKIKVTVRSGDVTGITIDKMYIGIQAGSGDAWDFADTPTKITWSSGSDSITIAAANTDATSDEITFSFSDANSYIISFYIASSAESWVASNAVQWWYKTSGGDESATVDVTGYSNAGNYFANVKKIEAEAAAANLSITTSECE